jgi:hypothetical protein
MKTLSNLDEEERLAGDASSSTLVDADTRTRRRAHGGSRFDLATFSVTLYVIVLGHQVLGSHFETE